MNGDGLLFFDKSPGAIPLYAAFDEALEVRFGPQEPRIQKTQITYGNPKVYACVSVTKGKKKGWPENGILVTFGLGRRLDLPRIAAAVEPYPGRWTHHVVVGAPGEIDGELMNWVEEAYQFSKMKKRG